MFERLMQFHFSTNGSFTMLEVRILSEALADEEGAFETGEEPVTGEDRTLDGLRIKHKSGANYST